jgi:acetyltransferase
MGGPDVQAGEEILNRVDIPTFPYPDTAARMFHYMWQYSDNLRALYETPALPLPDERAATREGADALLRAVRQSGRTLLTELESKTLLQQYGIPTVTTRLAADAAEAVAIAEALGFPVVLKLHSETLTHKTDVGGVKLDLRDAAAVREAYRAIEASVTAKAGREHFLGVTVQPMVKLDGYELILGSSIDPQFGPVLLFGSGGVLVEVYKDRALGLPPLTSTLARQMIDRTKIAKALAGLRGRPAVDREALEHLLVLFSHMIVEQPTIQEVDINPLLASPDRLVALDARVVLHPPDVTDDRLPRPAVRPYPRQYVTRAVLKDETAVLIRPVRAEDEPLFVRFHETLSERTVYLRYLGNLKLDQRIAHQRLSRLCFVDYDREMALVAEVGGGASRAIAGVARLKPSAGRKEAEFALLVADPYQGRGLGGEMLQRLVDVARAEGLKRLTAEIAPENAAMQRLCRRLGFSIEGAPQAPAVRAVLDI